jgi:hypothetical protein
MTLSPNNSNVRSRNGPLLPTSRASSSFDEYTTPSVESVVIIRDNRDLVLVNDDDTSLDDKMPSMMSAATSALVQ